MGRSRHALVVGGTGMLREVVLALAREGPVSVIARGRARLDALAAAARGITPLCVDYGRRADLEAALREAVRARGRFSLAVAWVHADAPGAAETAAGFVKGPFFHVLGSLEADPARADPGRRSRFAAVPGILYHEVILGFVRVGDRSRWLTDGEISRGVLDAVAAAEPRRIVGTVEPWSARP